MTEIKTRSITVWESNFEAQVANETTHNMLIDENGEPRNAECRKEDSEISCYVPDDLFDTLSDRELEVYCNHEFYDADGFSPYDEFDTGFKSPVDNTPIKITRGDYEWLPCRMLAYNWTDEQMQKLADMIGKELQQYRFDATSTSYEDEVDDAFWKEMEDCAVDMGMEYYGEI